MNNRSKCIAEVVKPFLVYRQIVCSIVLNDVENAGGQVMLPGMPAQQEDLYTAEVAGMLFYNFKQQIPPQKTCSAGQQIIGSAFHTDMVLVANLTNIRKQRYRKLSIL
jgi:hypothetical protein